MSISEVQKKTVIGGDVASIACAFNSDVTAGNLIVIAIGGYNPTSTQNFNINDIAVHTGTCTLGTWTLDVANIKNTITVALFSVPVTSNGSCTININTIAVGGSGNKYLSLGIVEYTGADISLSRLIGTNTNTGDSGTSATSNNVVSPRGAVFVTQMATYNSQTYENITDFDIILGNPYYGASSAHRIVLTATTDSADWTWNTSSYWVVVLAAYYEKGTDSSTLILSSRSLGRGLFSGIGKGF